MHHGPVLAVVLLLAVAALVTLARRLGIAYPIFLVIGGLLLGFIPGVPAVQVEPDLILLFVLPPILYIAAYFTPLRSLRENFGIVASLAVGLVIASALAVAAVARLFLPELPWAIAVALGAIVAPPDAIAATAVAARLAVPRRILTILEGESLLNDATALTIYSVVLAAAARRFSAGEALATFALALIGGIAIGLVVAWTVTQIRARIDDTPVEMTISLVTPYAAFLPAAQLGVSGVIATVAAGLYLGAKGSRITGPDTRLTVRPVWETITFLLNGFVFIVTGLAVPIVLRSMALADAVRLVAIGVAVTAVLVAVRALWVFGMLFLLPPHGDRSRRVAEATVLSWAGMRGAVSLAAALALPVALPDGRPLPAREALLIVTLTVIVLTLVGQGLTLPWLIRTLRLGGDVEIREEESTARQELIDAAARRIDELYPVWPGHHPLLDRLRAIYQHRSEHVGRSRAATSGEDQEVIEHREIGRTVIGAERETLLRLRAEGAIDDDVLRKLERELDIEEQRLDAS